MNINWDSVRAIFGGKLTQGQVDGINAIVSIAIGDEFKISDKRQVAYMLATSFWETGRTMQAVHEKGGNAYFTRMYDIKGERPALARRLGNTTPGDGIKYAGRGHVQLTGKANYEKMGKFLGLDIVSFPDLVLDLIPSVRIMCYGMIKGSFTGVGLNKYINASGTDYVNARRIINGVDKASTIANIAKQFERALS